MSHSINKNNGKKQLPPTSRSLPIMLIRARESIMPPIRDMLSASGITEQQWRVLRVLSEYGAQDTSSVAQHACLLLPSLTRISQKMRDNGLITLSRDTHDRRRQTIEITKSGQQIVDENNERATEIVESFKETLGEHQYEQLLDLLAQLDSPIRS